jgi:hypothetical protein
MCKNKGKEAAEFMREQGEMNARVWAGKKKD